MSKVFATLDDGSRIAISVPEQHRDTVLAAWRRNALDPNIPEQAREIALWDMARAAWITANAKRVSDEIREERFATCEKCEYARQTALNGQAYCSLCKCNLSPTEKLLPNLAAIEERLPEWGCHHPQRFHPTAPKKGWER